MLDAFLGGLLGAAVGDALGQPFKGWSAGRIDRETIDLDRALGRGRAAASEDTALTIVVARWLLEDEALEARTLARRIADAYDADLGHGRATTEFMRRLRDGENWETASSHCFARGSFGNGAAARVAPVALRYHRDRRTMEHVAETSALVTHVHPLGIAGAIEQARQIVIALEHRGVALDPVALAVELRSTSGSQEFRQKLRAVEDCVARRAGIRRVRERLGCNATALGSVPTALYCFLAHPASFEEAIAAAVALGGETDSIASMTGAIAGVYHGLRGVPPRWIAKLEDGVRGSLEGLARKLAERAGARS